MCKKLLIQSLNAQIARHYAIYRSVMLVNIGMIVSSKKARKLDMNIPNKVGIAFEKTVLFSKRVILSERRYLHRLELKSGSYLANVFCMLYEAYFSNYTNVYREYIRYYCLEFDSYENYLKERYSLTDQEIKAYGRSQLCCSQYIDYYSNSTQLLDDEELETCFWKAVIK